MQQAQTSPLTHSEMRLLLVALLAWERLAAQGLAEKPLDIQQIHHEFFTTQVQPVKDKLLAYVADQQHNESACRVGNGACGC